MTNYELVMSCVFDKFGTDTPIEYNENLFTLASWNKMGYKVKKGQKSLISCKIWKPKTKAEIEREKEKAIAENKKPNNSRMKLVNANFFYVSQVEKVKEKTKG